MDSPDAATVLRAIAQFKRDPDAFLLAAGMDEDALVQLTLVALTAEGRDDTARVHLLLLWQEFAALLFHDSKRCVSQADRVWATPAGPAGRPPSHASPVQRAEVGSRTPQDRQGHGRSVGTHCQRNHRHSAGSPGPGTPPPPRGCVQRCQQANTSWQRIVWRCDCAGGIGM